MCGQVTPSRVTSTAGVSSDILNGNSASQHDGIPVIERGVVCHWDGLEALLHDLLYHQVRLPLHRFSALSVDS